MNPSWKQLAEAQFRQERVRADYIHEDEFASLGLAVLYRCPLSFLSRAERQEVCGAPESEVGSLLKYLPDAVRLDDVVFLLTPEQGRVG